MLELAVPENEGLVEDRIKVSSVDLSDELFLAVGQEVHLNVRVGGPKHVLHGEIGGLDDLCKRGEPHQKS